MTQALNGAGDTKTPSWINLVSFWLIQIPLAYVLAENFELGPTGVFAAVFVGESVMGILAIRMFLRGAWKQVKI